MKSRLRKISVQNNEFWYSLGETFDRSERTDYGFWINRLRVFKPNQKNTPLEIVFFGQNGYAVGNLLTCDMKVKRGEEVVEFNLHRPAIISLLIEEGLRLGWDGDKEHLKIEDGVSLLETIGFDVSDLRVYLKE